MSVVCCVVSLLLHLWNYVTNIILPLWGSYLCPYTIHHHLNWLLLQPITPLLDMDLSKLAQTFQFPAILIQHPPAISCRSWVQRAGGRPTQRLPTRSLHSLSRLLKKITTYLLLNLLCCCNILWNFIYFLV